MSKTKGTVKPMNGNDVKTRRSDGRAEPGQNECECLANALRFEREKNKVLLDEVIGLEDALVNRQMAEFDAVISDDTREFWREQLLANREKAEIALAELARSVGSSQGAVGRGEGRRPLHNRAGAKPAARGVDGSPTGGAAEGKAVKIRNRAHELSKTEGIPFSTAFRRAEREVCGE